MAVVTAKYKCPICDFVYDPEEGDWRCGAKPGTPFENLPADWRCPACYVPKGDFVKLD